MIHYRRRSRRNFLNITLYLIIINIIVFLVTLPFLEYFNYLAISPMGVLQGKIWTILTSMFMHAPGYPFHLFINMLSLFFLGSFLERIIGSKKFLFAYLGAGILGALFFVATPFIFGGDVNMMAVGASGAIFGLGGMLAVLTPRVPVYIMFIPIAMPMWFGITFALVVLWLISILGNLPIGNTAHLGGLVFGLLYACYLRSKKKRVIYHYF